MKIFKNIFCLLVPVVVGFMAMFGVVCSLSKKERSAANIRRYFAEDTGASSASKSQKGGSIYLEDGAIFTMSGGTISGGKNTYGGAVYVAKGSTFTMNGGTITKCEAKYGGAIYIESGGTCIINGGKIVENIASVAPAIYVESGGILMLKDDTEIKDNVVGKWLPFDIGAEMELGAIGSGIKLKTLQYGTYPQTIVDKNKNTELENWYNSTNPEGRKFLESHENEFMGAQGETAIIYELEESELEIFDYTDGKSYLRATLISEAYSGELFSDPQINYYELGEPVWFKVEPITWYILNYEKAAVDGYYELLSAVALFQNSNYSSVYDVGLNLYDNFVNNSLIYDMLHYRGVFAEQSQIGKDVSLVRFSDAVHISIPNREDFFDVSGKYYSLFNSPSAAICSPSDFVIARSTFYDSIASGAGTGTVFNAQVNCYYWLMDFNVNGGGLATVVMGGRPEDIPVRQAEQWKIPTRIMIRV